MYSLFSPSASKASREAANLTERKNPHTLHMVSKTKLTIFLPSSMVAQNGNFTKKIKVSPFK